METEQDAVLCRIYISEEDKVRHHSLLEWIVVQAKDLNIAGVTVLRGVLGYGVHRQLHTGKILRLAEDMPLVIEMVDHHAAIAKLLKLIEPEISEGMVTTQPIRVRFIPHRSGSSSDPR